MTTIRPVLFAVAAALALSGSAAEAGDIQVWLTTQDATKQLAREADISFADGRQAATITIDTDIRYQEIVGFGAALTDASAWLIQTKMTEAQRTALLNELFGRGLGLSFTRLTIGASDFSRRQYSFDDQPKGARDPDLKDFSIERAEVLPVIKQALVINPQLKIMASPWSAPGWMKSSDSLIQGSLLPEAFPAYAEYFRRTIDAYAAEGVPLYAITIQNEPHYEPTDYPGMRVTPPMRAAFIGSYLGPLLSKSHPEVRIWDWDHNWDEPQSPLTVLADPNAARYIAGVAWHCYAGEPSAQGPVHDAHPDKETWFTECSGGEWSQWKDALPWMAGALVQTTRQWSKGVLFWNLALDENHGPHTGGCSDCRGVVTIDSASGTVTRNVEYYILGHASRFVKPGASRIDSGPAIAGLDDVAFRNTDGSIVLIAVNRQSEPRAFAVRQKDHGFEYTLAPGSVATFVWR